MCILLVSLLKVVSHYDLSVLSMSVMGFQKKMYSELYSVYFNSFNFANPLNRVSASTVF